MSMEQSLRADIDPVTQAYTRARLASRLDALEQTAAAGVEPCSLFLFDADFFKSVNDSYGHARGDAILHQLADRVRELSDGRDELYRYGGDEFVLLLPGVGPDEAARRADALAAGGREQMFPGDPPLRMSISIGVASFPEDATDATALLVCADRRNYLAKGRGRAQAVAADAGPADAG